MSKLQTRREWAAERGLCKAGVRGRLPKAATEAIEKAMADGVRFADAEAVSTVPPDGQGRVLVVRANRPAAQDVIDIPEYIRNIDHEVYEFVNGKKVHRAMSEVCRNCRASLVVCACGNPRIVSRDGNPDGVLVYFGNPGYGDMR